MQLAERMPRSKPNANSKRKSTIVQLRCQTTSATQKATPPQILDMESLKVKHKMLNAHESPLYKVKPIDAHVCSSGDEDGTVKLWDYRQRQSKAVLEHKAFDDFVSDFYVDDDCRVMIASSGEGMKDPVLTSLHLLMESQYFRRNANL